MQSALHRLPVLFAVCAFLQPLQPQSGSAAKPATPSEVLQYEVEWRLVRAGTARLSRIPQGTSTQYDLHLDSAGLVSKLYRVNDNYSVTFDSNYCAAGTFMRSEEGARRRETTVTFDRERKKAVYNEKDLVKNGTTHKELDIPPCVQDVVTALTRLRATKPAIGQSVTFPITDGKRIINAKIEAQEKEKVKTPTGTYDAIRYEAFLFNDQLYVRKGRLFVWITDDDRRLPVQIRVRLNFPVGTISLQLEKLGQ